MQIKIENSEGEPVPVEALHITASGKLAVHAAVEDCGNPLAWATITHIPTGYGIGQSWFVDGNPYTLDAIKALADKADALDWDFTDADNPPSATRKAYKKMRAEFIKEMEAKVTP